MHGDILIVIVLFARLGAQARRLVWASLEIGRGMRERVAGIPVVAPPQTPAELETRATGTVRWYSSEKGYGFIDREDGVEYFVRYSEIAMEGFKELTEGQRVSFEVGDDGRGPVALNVCPLEPL